MVRRAASGVRSLIPRASRAETQSRVSAMEGFFKMASLSRRLRMAWATWTARCSLALGSLARMIATSFSRSGYWI